MQVEAENGAERSVVGSEHESSVILYICNVKNGDRRAKTKTKQRKKPKIAAIKIHSNVFLTFTVDFKTRTFAIISQLGASRRQRRTTIMMMTTTTTTTTATRTTATMTKKINKFRDFHLVRARVLCARSSAYPFGVHERILLPLPTFEYLPKIHRGIF